MLEKVASNGNSKAFHLSVPMQRTANCDFSYSGMKTQVRLIHEELEKANNLNDESIANLCASFQRVCHRLCFMHAYLYLNLRILFRWHLSTYLID